MTVVYAWSVAHVWEWEWMREKASYERITKFLVEIFSMGSFVFGRVLYAQHCGIIKFPLLVLKSCVASLMHHGLCVVRSKAPNRCVCFSLLTPSFSLSNYLCCKCALSRCIYQRKKNDRATVSMGGMQTALVKMKRNEKIRVKKILYEENGKKSNHCALRFSWKIHGERFATLACILRIPFEWKTPVWMDVRAREPSFR